MTATIKGLPSWAVGLFGGLGVLVVGLGIFSVVLKARDEGAESARARAHRAPRPPAAERTMPAAVVEQLAPPSVPGQAGLDSDVGKSDLKADNTRPLRGRRLPRAGTGEGATGEGETDSEAQPTPVEKAVAAAAAPEPEPEADVPSLEDAERMQQQMESVLAGLGPKIEECAHAADVSGDVEVRVAVSQDGTVKASRLVGDLDGTPAAACIHGLVKQTRYQRFKGPSIKLSHKFSVQ